MIGRGVFKNLHVFAEKQPEWELTERLQTLLWHVDLYEETWGNTKSYEPLKKFFKIYINGFAGASTIRNILMETHSPDQARVAVKAIAQSTSDLVNQA
jgi:tRNA-dihydrouridine synthase